MAVPLAREMRCSPESEVYAPQIVDCLGRYLLKFMHTSLKLLLCKSKRIRESNIFREATPQFFCRLRDKWSREIARVASDISSSRRSSSWSLIIVVGG